LWMVTDSVCGMRMRPEEAHSKIEYEGKIAYFCSKHCEAEFKKNPQKYLSKLKSVTAKKHNTTVTNSLKTARHLTVSILCIEHVCRNDYKTKVHSAFETLKK